MNKTEITRRQSVQAKIFKISYNIISKVLSHEMLKEFRLGALFFTFLHRSTNWSLNSDYEYGYSISIHVTI
jgi:hypothetical protein